MPVTPSPAEKPDFLSHSWDGTQENRSHEFDELHEWSVRKSAIIKRHQCSLQGFDFKTFRLLPDF